MGFAEPVIGRRGACHRAALRADPLAPARWLNPSYTILSSPHFELPVVTGGRSAPPILSPRLLTSFLRSLCQNW